MSLDSLIENNVPSLGDILSLEGRDPPSRGFFDPHSMKFSRPLDIHADLHSRCILQDTTKFIFLHKKINYTKVN